MKFDPDYFLKIANRSGVKLTLNNQGGVLFSATGGELSTLFLIAARKHKRKITSHLKKQPVSYTQTDLFAGND